MNEEIGYHKTIFVTAATLSDIERQRGNDRHREKEADTVGERKKFQTIIDCTERKEKSMWIR